MENSANRISFGLLINWLNTDQNIDQLLFNTDHILNNNLVIDFVWNERFKKCYFVVYTIEWCTAMRPYFSDIIILDLHT